MQFPWSAVVGQDALKQALILCAIDPAIGGVLVHGPRGVAKTTLARALAELVPGAFVELPLGATEERVTGTLNLERAMRDGRVELAPGLLARAHDGVLYVDEVNLLPDALVDLLLDAAATGRNIVERDGVSHTHAARFVLIGSMNPEEGELRPQLIDRFGLSASAQGSIPPGERAEIVMRRLEFDRDPERFRAAYAARQAELVERCRGARERASAIPMSGPALVRVTERCHAAGVEGVRADLAMLRAARAHAAWNDRSEITLEDVDAVAELALAHRMPRGSGNEPQSGGGRGGAAAPSGGRGAGSGGGGASFDGAGADAGAESSRAAADAVSGVLPARPVRAAPVPELPIWMCKPRGRRPGRIRKGTAQLSAASGQRGRARQTGSVDWFATLRDHCRSSLPGALARSLNPDQLRYRERRRPASQLWIVAVDCSSSMLRSGGLGIAKGVASAFDRRAKSVGARLAVISFRGAGANLEVDSSPGRAVIPRAIAALGGGGGTPLNEALAAVQALCKQTRWSAQGVFKRLLVLTDGRVKVPRSVASLPSDLERVVVDCESGRLRLGKAVQLAAALQGDYWRPTV
jgi:magnesium chelatase subunit D